MSETELMMATQQISLLRMQMLRQHQAVRNARLQGGVAYDNARANLDAVISELDAAERAFQRLTLNA